MIRRAGLLTVALAVALPALGRAGEFQVADGVEFEGTHQGTKGVGPDGRVSVIVKFDVDSLATYKGGRPGLAATSAKSNKSSRLQTDTAAAQSYLNFLEANEAAFEREADRVIPEASVVHRYRVVVGGVSMRVPPEKIDALRKLPGVREVYMDELMQVDTDRSPAIISAPDLWNADGGKTNAGAGMVVGVLDTGIWPESPSFTDPSPSGGAYPAPPPTWTGSACDFTGGVNPGPVASCNNKLIGARRVMATYEANVALKPGEFTTARDDDGHGTHTSSTAAGNGGVMASFTTVVGGPSHLITGIAPRAHVAMYKVCGNAGCFGSDSVAAVEQAILDGVNVINFSISGGTDPFSDAVELAFKDAYDAGVFVAASAGNSGPTTNTVAHRGPWVTTVAATTTDRVFVGGATLTLTTGPAVLTISGSSLMGPAGPAPIVLSSAAPYSNELCGAPAAPGTFTGMIVACKRGTNGRVEKGTNVLAGGAVGMILYNASLAANDTVSDVHALPAIHIDYAQGTSLVSFLSANPASAVAQLTGGVRSLTGQKDKLASFSSRGGTGITGVAKPDVGAPGVDTWAATTPAPCCANSAAGVPGNLFILLSGTSMASPHVAGAAALMKQLHPSWGPGQIKSALMTTAFTGGVKEDGVTPVDAFDSGSGRINLKGASLAKFTISDTSNHYVLGQSHLELTNYPSIFLSANPGIFSVNRTVHNESGSPLTLAASAPAGSDFTITAAPTTLTVPPGGNGTFQVTVDARHTPLGALRFGNLNIGGGHVPVTFIRKNGNLDVVRNCTPTSLAINTSMDCSITLTNNATSSAALVTLTDVLKDKLKVTSVTGGTLTAPRTVTYSGSLSAANLGTMSFVTTGGPAGGYLPLSVFGIAPFNCGVSCDDVGTAFTVPTFYFTGLPYTRLVFGSNGAITVGAAGAVPSSVNEQLPNATGINNIMAPYWTDLWPTGSGGSGAGAMRIGTLTDGSTTWIVCDWQAVRHFSDAAKLASFEIWLRIQGGAAGSGPGSEEISFNYGTLAGGLPPSLSVAAEDATRTVAATQYFSNGVTTIGTAPASNGTGYRPQVTGIAPGGSATILYTAKGIVVGPWADCSIASSNAMLGQTTSCLSGDVH